jgi:hypothetical protein
LTAPQFLRRYLLNIQSASVNNGPVTNITINSDDEPTLRITFDVQTFLGPALWTAQISVYNLNEQSAQVLINQGNSSPPVTNSSSQTVPIEQGMSVALSAGYYGNGANYGLIWEGYVLQVLWERENQTDFKLTLNCILGLDPTGMQRNPVIQPGVATTQRQLLLQMLAQAYHPIQPGVISESLSQKVLPRGRPLFGSPKKYLSEISRDNNAQWWLGQKGLLNLSNLNYDLAGQQPALTLTPTTGIIGTPRQTQKGVTFRTLMNPNINITNPAMFIKLDQTQYVRLLQQLGDLTSIGILAQSGVYAVVGARYLGDSRGQDWYTDVVGWLTGADKIAATDVLGAYLTGA